MTKNVLKIIGALVLFGLLLLFAFNWDMLRGALPAITGPDENIADIIEENNNAKPGENATNFPLRLPDNFKIEILAKDLPGARVMVFDPVGDYLYVSQTSQGKITRLKMNGPSVVEQEGVFDNLRRPHGIVFDTDPVIQGVEAFQKLYIAEEHQITTWLVDSTLPRQKIADLPTQGGGHFTRTVEFGPDGRLYVSIGSSCNVCDENDPRRAAIYVMNKDGSGFQQYVKGLRNSVFFTWSDLDGSMWATEMGRDNLGDNTPPDEINVIKEGSNYGWPICYGQNILDTQFDKKTYIQNPCSEQAGTTGSKVDLQAHSAPLGLDFVPEEGWPEDYWYDLIVAYHGSWNRTTPTGYKLVRIKLDENGNYQGIEDFITGWLTGNSVLGRPVDVMIQPGGVMYVSDDHAGVIYKISLTVPPR